MVANPAAAQDEEADQGADSGNTIVVTAQFREQVLQDIPLAITAVNSDMLESRSQTNLTEVTQQAPSVTLRPSGADFGPSISASIRGLGQIDFDPLVEPGVGIYIDDVYYPRLIGANFELLDVERVEILRGPQGTLTGRNSEGGAIRFISKKPDGNLGGFGQVTYGSRDRINLQGALSFPLGEDFAGRISGAYGNQDGYVQGYDYGCLHPESGVPAKVANSDCETADYGDVNYWAVRGALRYNPSSDIDIQLIGDFTEDDTNQSGNVLLFAGDTNPNGVTENGIALDERFICGPFCNYADSGNSAAALVSILPGLTGLPLSPSTIGNTSYYKGWGLSLNAELGLTDNLNLTSISAYRRFESTFDTDGDLAPTRMSNTFMQFDTEFYSQELRVNAELSDAIELTVGGYYAKEDTVQDYKLDLRYIAAGPGLPLYALQFIGGGPVEVESLAAFSTVFIRPTDALTITLGGRYTDESKSTTYKRLNYDDLTPNPFVDPIGAAYGIGYSGADTLDTDGDLDTAEIVTALNGLTSSFKGQRFDYRASVDYRFSDQVLVYVTTGTGYKGGGISPRPFVAAQAVPFGTEELTAYEVGIKTDLLDDRVRLNVSGYINKYKDAQLTLLSCPQFGGPGPCALPQNAGDATIKGVEVELTAEPFDGFDINASLSALDWTWDCVVPTVVVSTADAAATCTDDPAYVDLLAAPPRGVVATQWSIGAQYAIDMSSAGSLTPRLDVSYQSEQATSATVPPAGTPTAIVGDVKPYTLTNARLTWRSPDEDWAVSLAVTNLFDKYYFYSYFDLTGAGAGFIYGSPARPREWSLSVKKTF